MIARPAHCLEYQQLKHAYESALQEAALYNAGGAASLQQAHRFREAAQTVRDRAGSFLHTHLEVCQVCQRAEGDQAYPN